MISFQKNSTALRNLPLTIEAIATIDHLLAVHSDERMDGRVVRVGVDKPGGLAREIQLDVEILRVALGAQRLNLIAYLRTLGIDYDA